MVSVETFAVGPRSACPAMPAGAGQRKGMRGLLAGRKEPPLLEADHPLGSSGYPGVVRHYD